MLPTRTVVQNETKLEQCRLSRPYRNRLQRGLQHLLLWLSTMGAREGDWIHNLEVTNQVLADYLGWCHSHGVQFTLAQHALLAFQTRHGHLKTRLGRAWDSIKAWKMELPQHHRLPMPMVVLQALFGTLVSCALAAPSGATWITVAVLTRVAYYALLRPGELLALRRADIKFILRDDSTHIMVIGIKDPKNRSAMGRTQFATITDQATVTWARWLWNSTLVSQKLWPGNKANYLAVFRTGLKLAGAQAMGLTLGSLRPGGTTHYYLHGLEVSRIKLAGRWANEQSLTHYIQEAMSFMIWGTLTIDNETRVKQTAHLSHFAWLEPPGPDLSRRLVASWPRSAHTKRGRR